MDLSFRSRLFYTFSLVLMVVLSEPRTLEAAVIHTSFLPLSVCIGALRGGGGGGREGRGTSLTD